MSKPCVSLRIYQKRRHMDRKAKEDFAACKGRLKSLSLLRKGVFAIIFFKGERIRGLS